MDNSERISSKIPFPSKYVEVNGSKIHYLQAGNGKPILFLHGVPLSSYSWRNIIPHLATLGTCIAPDLIGMGQSDRPNIKYTIQDHIEFINGFIQALKLKDITIVMHGWGSIIGFAYAMANEKNCRALIFYEAFLRSLDGEDLSLPFQEQIREMQDLSFDFINQGASFVDSMLPQQIMRSLSDEEKFNYREPFSKTGSAKALAQYMKDLTTISGRNELDKIITDYSKKLTQSKLPKLMLYTVPGFVTTIATIMWAKDNLPNLEIIDIGEELHLAQEATPQVMGESISVWLQGLEATRK